MKYKTKQEIEEECEDYSCKGYFCRHETFEKHYILTLDFITKIRQNDKEAIVEMVESIDHNAHNKVDKMYGVVAGFLKDHIINKIKEM
jgi:hypothetical protein